MKKPATFEDAYRILDQACTDLREPKIRPLIDETVRSLKANARTEIVDRVQAQTEFIALGFGHAEDVLHQVGESVKQDPLLYIGAAVLTAGAISLVVSKSRGSFTK